jgi:hypothetical protein
MRASTRALGRAECLRTALERRATEDEVRAFFARYKEHTGLAGIYALHNGYI